MEKDVLSGFKRKSEGFLKRQDWNVSGVLVLILYVIMLVYVNVYLVEENYIESVIHVLPVISLALFILGYIDRKKNTEQERERKSKRYQARMALSRLRRRSGTSHEKPGGE